MDNEKTELLPKQWCIKVTKENVADIVKWVDSTIIKKDIILDNVLNEKNKKYYAFSDKTCIRIVSNVSSLWYEISDAQFQGLVLGHSFPKPKTTRKILNILKYS